MCIEFIRVHRYRWIQLACTVGCTSHTLIYSHQSASDSRGSTCGMTAMPKHWSDPGHSPFLKGNVINYNSVYFMRLGEVHHHESQHGERINIVFAGVLCSSCIPRVHFSLHEKFSFERRNSTVCIICLGAETQTAKDLINKSQCCHHENEIGSL